MMKALGLSLHGKEEAVERRAPDELHLRIAGELEALRLVALRLEHAVWSHPSAVPSSSAKLKRLEDADVFLQRLSALRDVVSSLARRAPGDTIDLAAALSAAPQGDLRARLGGDATAPRDASGDLDC